jgi:hypothetical protein
MGLGGYRITAPHQLSTSVHASVPTLTADDLEPFPVVDGDVVPEIRAPGHVVPALKPEFPSLQRSLQDVP